MQPRKEAITKKSRQRQAICSLPQNDLHADIPDHCFKNGWHLKTTPNSEPLTQQVHAKLLLKTTNFCSHVTEHHSAAEVCLCPPSGTNELARPAPSLKVDSWLSWHRNAKLDPFVHQPSSTQNCWTLPELSVSSLLAPRLGLRIFRLRNMWKYNDNTKYYDNSCNCNNNDQIKLYSFCLTTRSFLHISYVPFHKLRHRKKTQHVKKYPQHRRKLLTMNGISSNLSLSCRVAQEGNWPPRIRSCSRQGFILHVVSRPKRRPWRALVLMHTHNH